jgi:uncharacterized iron-regulated protein
MIARSAMLAFVMGCAGHYGGTPAGHPTKALGAGPGIAAAGLPFEILDRGGHGVDATAFWGQLAQASAVCVGEEHPNPHHHWMQLEVVKHLVAGSPFGVGMEMVQRPFQGVLDDFATKKIDDATFTSRAGWADRWGYPYELYGPILHVAIDAHASLVALNAPKELTKKVSHHGLDALTPDERAQLPELDLKVSAHRAWFDSLMEEMGGGAAHAHAAHKDDAKADGKDEPAKDADPHHDEMPAMPSMDQIYTVQVIWDETMADTGAKWLVAHPHGHLVILAGNGHCHDSAIVGRMKRRGVGDAVSVRVVIDDGEGAVAEALAKPMNDYVVVMKLPPGTKPEEKKD